MPTKDAQHPVQGGPGIAAWSLLGVSTVALVVGLYIVFPLPLISGLWAFADFRLAADKPKKQWGLYIALSLILAVSMLVLWLFLSPGGDPEQVRIGQTAWGLS
ncbi:hypothetical protein KRX51_08910 [Corynebacterium sp. TAE3-ERU12]|uniref:hypothetical protein n=1 Tax=Corynebacterium sp. TAE3-ERU12 TaxID=2849491 RepID=UPI001C47A926|nr:hypothetical protein [Corynebacterium sp. TAE3-ERU12]MBV7296028.1 hypothetical protein [Corynebacterium sp. TAE3-ERU12]